MKSLLSSAPVLWFLFLFNLVVAVVAAFAVDGAQGLMTSIGMGVVAFGAGAALLQRRFDRAVRSRIRPLGSTREAREAGRPD